MGAISLGYGPDGKRIRRKVSGKTKQAVTWPTGSHAGHPDMCASDFGVALSLAYRTAACRALEGPAIHARILPAIIMVSMMIL